ncbi:MAG: DUF6787 family protein [Bacteroidota bacterium]
MSEKSGWVQKLKERWQLKSAWQVIIILIVFACTGFSVLYLKRPVLAMFANGSNGTLVSVIYYILILPIYNIILLFYGFIFGQFKFFWEFEKRTFSRIKNIFKR